MISWLSKFTFFAGAIIALLSIILLILSQTIDLGPQTATAGNTELILIIVPKILLVISAAFLFRRNKKGLYVLYSALFASAIHSIYVLGVLESGKRYLSDMKFLTDPFIYWAYKSVFYIIPLILYLVWILYWFNELKQAKHNSTR